MAIAHMDQAASNRPRIGVSAVVALLTSLLAISVVLSTVPILLVQYYF